jgi:tetratricopeptide (TPR) repeat protein
MGLLLCTEYAEHPYHYEKLDVDLWSIQELCYVLYHYPVIIPEDFVDKRLINWLRGELQLETLAAKLEQFMGAGENRDAMILMILREGNYYTQVEIATFAQELRRLKEIDRASFNELLGDTFFRMGKYGRAVESYQESVQEGKDPRVQMKLGDSYVTVMEFRRASDLYEEIYIETNSEKPLQKLYFLNKLEPSVNTISKYVNYIDTAKLSDWEHTYDAVLKKVENSERVDKINKIYQQGSVEFRKAAAELIHKWKRDYRDKV